MTNEAPGSHRGLRAVAEAALAEDSLTAGLGRLAHGLAEGFACDAAALLALDDVPTLVVAFRPPVSKGFAAAVERAAVSRYEAHTGTFKGDPPLLVEYLGDVSDAPAPATIGSVLAAPIEIGDRFSGVLLLAGAGKGGFSSQDPLRLGEAADCAAIVLLALRRMKHLSSRDGLTGVFNRGRFEEELERALLLAGRYRDETAVLVLDVDGLKATNDTYGHAAGDELLRDFADLLRTTARASDVVARLGGDEFGVLLPRTPPRDAYAFGERLLAAIRGCVFCRATHPLRLTASVGLATARAGAKDANATTLLARADRALYAAKQQGKNRIAKAD